MNEYRFIIRIIRISRRMNKRCGKALQAAETDKLALRDFDRAIRERASTRLLAAIDCDGQP